MFGVKILEECKSKYNGSLRVVRCFGLGTYIQADGLTQSGGIVETFWRQTLKKIKNSKLNVGNCLILGLGGGSAAKIVKNLWKEALITGVDIDPKMIKLGKKYLGLEADKIVICDAYNFDSVGYDLVIVDLYSGDNFPKKFEDDKFLKKISQNKIVVFNRLYYKEKRKEAEKFGENLKKIFNNVEYFYPITNLMFLCS